MTGNAILLAKVEFWTAPRNSHTTALRIISGEELADKHNQISTLF